MNDEDFPSSRVLTSTHFTRPNLVKCTLSIPDTHFSRVLAQKTIKYVVISCKPAGVVVVYTIYTIIQISLLLKFLSVSLSGIMKPGLNAIMGATGSGKSS